MPPAEDDAKSPPDAFALEGVSVAFGETRALEDVSLRLAEGGRVAIVGPSGGGKTTLLRVLNAALRPGPGEAAVFGQDLAGLGPRDLRALRARIGLVPQDIALVPGYRVIQNVLCGRLGRRGFWGGLRDLTFPRSADVEAAHQILERVGVGEKLYHRTDTLSGGQQQRAAVARALFQEPDALLADEPVSSVDPARARDTVALLTGLAEERGLTLVMSLHNLELAREFFPRLVGLRAGHIVFDSPAAELPDGAFHELYDLGQEEMLEA